MVKSYNRFLSKNDVENIHEHTLSIMKEVGVKVEHKEALEIFKSHGVKVEDNIVHLDEKTTEQIIKSAPEKFTRYSCKGSYEVGGGSRISRPADGSIYIEEDGVIRKMRNSDIINQFKLGEASKVMKTNDVNGFLETDHFSTEQRRYVNIAIALKYSHTAPIQLMPRTFPLSQNESVRKIWAKGLQICKQYEGTNDKYVITYGVNTLSPLCYDHDPVERILAHCDENQPLWISPCAMPLLTAPPSMAGMIAMTNAEVLTGLALVQLIKPGLPVVYGNTSASTDMKNIALAIGSPESALICYSTAALADYYKLPFRCGGNLSDAKELDVQCGAESMLMQYATLDAGTDVICHAFGIMGSFNVVSFEKYIIDEELYLMADRFINGINCSEENFCLDEIKKVEPRGSFMHGKTPKMFKDEFFKASYFNKQDPNEWQRLGSKSVKEYAKEEAIRRIESYVPPSIEKEQNELLMPYLPDEYKNCI